MHELLYTLIHRFYTDQGLREVDIQKTVQWLHEADSRDFGPLNDGWGNVDKLRYIGELATGVTTEDCEPTLPKTASVGAASSTSQPRHKDGGR